MDTTGVPTMYVFVDIGFDVAHLVDTVRLNFEAGARLALAGTIQFAGSMQARPFATMVRFGLEYPAERLQARSLATVIRFGLGAPSRKMTPTSRAPSQAPRSTMSASRLPALTTSLRCWVVAQVASLQPHLSWNAVPDMYSWTEPHAQPTIKLKRLLPCPLILLSSHKPLPWHRRRRRRWRPTSPPWQCPRAGRCRRARCWAARRRCWRPARTR